MTQANVDSAIVPDSQLGGWMALLPSAARPYASLARFDRPIGWWLLYWPCAWGVLLAGGGRSHFALLFWLLAGAIAMRGAGCVYNDILDRDLDRQVARTRERPIASGAVLLRNAWIWTITLCLAGLVVLLQLRWEAQIVALASVAFVAAYPIMKRITWWPQVWLGLVFSWGAPVGWFAVSGKYAPAMLLLYLGSICWVIGYDTIYALQDREDDALIGVRSSALRMGTKVRVGVIAFYAFALCFWAGAFWFIRPQPLVLLALFPVALHFLWQVLTLDAETGSDALSKFRSNRFAGFLIALATATVGASA